MNCKYWNEEHQDCAVGNNTYEQGFKDGVDDTITRLLESEKSCELSQKIAIDILERGEKRGYNKALDDIKQMFINCKLEYCGVYSNCMACTFDRVKKCKKNNN